MQQIPKKTAFPRLILAFFKNIGDLLKIKEYIGSLEKIGKNRKNRSTGQPAYGLDSVTNTVKGAKIMYVF